MKAALCQINTTIGAFDANVQAGTAAYRRAAAAGAHLAVLPEMMTTGYPPHDFLLRERFIDANLRALETFAKACDGPPAICGFVERNRERGAKKLFNAAAVIEGGRVTQITRKRLLPTYDVFDEARYFEPGTACEPVTAAGLRIGIAICEDAWNDADFWGEAAIYRQDPVAALVAAGASLLVMPSASPFHVGKPGLRRRMIAAAALKHGIPALFANLVGGNDELIFDGRSFAMDAHGRLLALATPFREDVAIADLDTDVPLPEPPAPDAAAEAYAALCLGLRDYCAKSGFRDAVLGLSGGIDSAVTAAIAAEALGAAHVHGVAMPSRYSSQGSLDDARALAQNLGIGFQVTSIEPLFEPFRQHITRPMASVDTGLAEQNIQARLRGNIIMALSNAHGWLALSTGNKSELATGYCTLYGDMCGGLAVLSDVPKTLVYSIAEHINRAGERIPYASITKPPSAELRPNQTDQDTLPPYEILDPIVRMFVEEERDPRDIAAAGFDPATVARVVALIDKNEYKRRQAAPGFKISPRAFGSGRRIPLAQRFRYGDGSHA